MWREWKTDRPASYSSSSTYSDALKTIRCPRSLGLTTIVGRRTIIAIPKTLVTRIDTNRWAFVHWQWPLHMQSCAPKTRDPTNP